MRESFKASLQELFSDNHSGSRQIASRAAALLRTAVAEEGIALEELDRLLREACRSLSAVHGTMRVIPVLCDEVIAVLDSGHSLDEVRTTLKDLLGRWDENYFARLMERMASNAYPLLCDAGTIVCHSFSSTVLGVLSRLVDRGLKPGIIQSVSAPANEGLRMASSLADAGLEVELIADAGLADAVSRADAVVVGADAVCLDGVVNKLGTLGLAAAASHHKVPTYAVFDITKLLPPGREPEITERDPAEIARPVHAQVKVRNVYFDVTPLPLFSAFVTEEGALSHDQLRALIESRI